MLSPERIAGWSHAYRDELITELRTRIGVVTDSADLDAVDASEWDSNISQVTGACTDLDDEGAAGRDDLAEVVSLYRQLASARRDYADTLRRLVEQIESYQ